MRKVWATVLITIGILVMMYPKIREAYYTHEQNNVLEQYEESMKSIGDMEKALVESEEKQQNDTNSVLKTKSNGSKIKIPKNSPILKIAKIDLYMPIMEGETRENLRVSVAHMNNTGKLGEVGNYAIAGHRCYTYGRHFNRLDEVEEGDEIIIFSKDDEYKYKVVKKFIVKPEEVGVLKGNGKDKLVTLITCTPIRVATHRLIIQGKLESVCKRNDN
ncbi:class D sortase [Clostridium aestuarii]|uniref:Class D sortase n=1 Tax=Clostridium aestuarii TaxID=338193 RepID=A0ABT4CWG5_9CLOT|nr:class D sortase [Clostridium aestuarii]MCY6483356.1 class D sortase [Clostridium aestuarii]